MPSKIVEDCCRLLQKLRLTIAFAESATAGRLPAEFALVPDCGDVLKGGIVCYDACIKQDILGVPSELVERFTPESAEVTEDLARRMKRFMKADIYVAVTGLTMPGGSESEEKPVGTMFIHILSGEASCAIRKVFQGSPEDIVVQTVDAAAAGVMDMWKQQAPERFRPN